ncbi:hypothetical protein ACN3XK_52185 [Actinomadura welshii]
MGAEHPTGTDTKVETADQPKPPDKPPPPPPDRPGSPGQPSRLESRAAAQRPPEAEEREAPPITRSARAEKSNDPNDDPNRVGTPRADSRREAAERNVPPTEGGSAEKPGDGPPGARTQRDDDPRDTESPRDQNGAPGKTDETASEKSPRDQDGGEEPKTREGRPLDPEAEQPDDDAPPNHAIRATPSDAAEREAPGSLETGEQLPEEEAVPTDLRSNDPKPPPDHHTPEREADERPAPEAEPGPGFSEDGPPPSDASAPTEPAETQPGEDAPRLDQRAPESDTDTVERVPDGEPPGPAEVRPPTEDGDRERESEPSPEAEPPDQKAAEETEPQADDSEHKPPADVPDQETPGETPNEPGDDDRAENTEERTDAPPPAETRDPFANLPTRADLDPVGAGVWLPDRNELAPVNENQDLREPDPEREPSWKRALRRLDDNLEEAQKNLSDYSKNAQEALGHRPPGDFPTSSRPGKEEFQAPDNTVNAPSAGLGVVALASIVYSLARASGSVTNDMRRRRGGDN